MTSKDLQGKKIAIVGLGVNNRSMANYFHKHGLSFDVVENWKHPDELIGRLDHYDIIFRTPGLPFLSEAVQQAKQTGVEISSQTKLFFKLSPAPIIGVTGTKGKGSTSSLIAKILQQANKPYKLAGNIGADPFGFLDELTSEHQVVMELSSFQLQDLEMSPHLAVVLNITPDHLNHHKDLPEYFQAKSNIIRYQTDNDFAILHKELPPEFSKLGSGQKVFFEPSEFKDWPTKLLGSHNLENIAAAVTCTRLLKIEDSIIREAVAGFEALPHRLKLVRQIDGVDYIDDGYSTNIGPVLAAINAFNQPVVLIIGGFDKGVDFSPLKDAISTSKVKAIVAIGVIANKIIENVSGFSGEILTGAQNMTEIITQASSLARPGDAVVFSPGTSSFDMFKNETDRAEQFVNSVNQL